MRIDDSPFADLEIDTLTVDTGMTLKVTRVTGGVDSLTIGNIGTGNMIVEAGGIVESYNGYVGEAGTATGSVLVSGVNSRWTVTEDLCLGYINTSLGVLAVDSGGQAEANSVWLGRADSAHGTLSVDGLNSSFTSHSVLAVGGFVLDDGTGGSAGGTGLLEVGNGGRVDIDKTLKVWGGGYVDVLYSGSTLRAGRIELAPGATLTTTSGTILEANELVGFGNATTIAGSLGVGISNGSGSGTHVVGVGQTLDVSDKLVIGKDGPGFLQIADGGIVTSQNGLVGQQKSANGSLVEIDGATSTWVIADNLDIGNDLPTQSNLRIKTTFGGRIEVGNVIRVRQNAELVLSPGILFARQLEVEQGALFDADGVMSLGGTGVLDNSGTLALWRERSGPTLG